jgi:uncharacterized protein (DUF488 family)
MSMMPTSQKRLVVLTVGHSTRPLEAFIRPLQAYRVTQVVDVRTVPRSRHNPQFNRETLPEALSAVGIGSVHLAGLGGFCYLHLDSPNRGWRNASFQGFADYMQTQACEVNLQRLMELA